MKYFTICILLTLSPTTYGASEVITCGDAMGVGGVARMALHNQAQERAQKAIEEFIERRLATPYINGLGMAGDEESMASVIEVFWCDSLDSPLHDAYYSLYSRNKHLFEGAELPIGFER
jgi:hypothetical protein